MLVWHPASSKHTEIDIANYSKVLNPLKTTLSVNFSISATVVFLYRIGLDTASLANCLHNVNSDVVCVYIYFVMLA